MITATLHTVSPATALVGFHSEDLFGLITGLALEQEGRLAPGSKDHDELIDEELSVEVAEALELERIDELIIAVQAALEERHWEIAEMMGEYRAGREWHRTWLDAMFAAAERVDLSSPLALVA